MALLGVQDLEVLDAGKGPFEALRAKVARSASLVGEVSARVAAPFGPGPSTNGSATAGSRDPRTCRFTIRRRKSVSLGDCVARLEALGCGGVARR